MTHFHYCLLVELPVVVFVCLSVRPPGSNAFTQFTHVSRYPGALGPWDRLNKLSLKKKTNY